MSVMAYPYAGYENQPSTNLPTEEDLYRMKMMEQEQNALDSWSAPAAPVAPQDGPQGMQGGLMMNHPQGGGLMGQMPQAPKVNGPQGDPSAMAAYGMQAPPLPDPSILAQLKALMSLQPQQQQRQQMPQGGLMAYLQQLGER